MSELGLKMRLKLVDRENSGNCVKNQIWKMGYVAALHDLDDLTDEPTLNENQQIVLEWLQKYMLDDSDFYNTIYASKQLYANGVPYGKESKAFTELNNRGLAQVLQAFSQWALEQDCKT